MRQVDGSGKLATFLDPHLNEAERKTAEIEGWILGVAGQTVRPSPRVSNTRAEREVGRLAHELGLHYQEDYTCSPVLHASDLTSPLRDDLFHDASGPYCITHAEGML